MQHRKLKAELYKHIKSEEGLTMLDIKKLAMEAALLATHGNAVQAAKLLDINRATIYNNLGGSFDRAQEG